MSRSADTVLAELLAISPPGDALPRDPSSMWAAMLKPLAAEIARFESYAEEMLIEVDPSQAVYLLTDYERVLGPDPYGRDSTTLSLTDERALTFSRWVARIGVRPADFIAFAATFGITITIREFAITTVPFTVDAELVNTPVQHQWVVNLPAAVVENLTVPFTVDSLIDQFAPSLVQPAIAGRAPAQTTPVFNYAT
jgi:uncharacterized protein YmfQ (DUF2313 family)